MTGIVIYTKNKFILCNCDHKPKIKISMWYDLKEIIIVKVLKDYMKYYYNKES